MRKLGLTLWAMLSGNVKGIDGMGLGTALILVG